MATPYQSPVLQLAAQHLQHPKFVLAPACPTTLLKRATATNHNGFDHLACESFVAILPNLLDPDGAYACVVSDRRILRSAPTVQRTVADEYDVPLVAVTGAHAERGVLTTKLGIVTGPRVVVLPLTATYVDPLVAFLDAVARLPPAFRAPPPRAAVVPTAEDPTGAAGLATALGTTRDGRVDVLLRLVHAAHARGELAADVGADLATRAWVLQQTLRFGRGIRRGFWQSALGMHDLLRVLVGVLGPPTGQQQHGGDTVFDFARARRDDAARAVASTAAGLAMLAVVGVGWVSVPREQIQGFRVVIQDQGGATGFMLLVGIGGRTIPFARHDAKAFEALLDDIARLEALLLLGRCALGWGPTPDQLMSVPRDVLAARVFEKIGAIDLAPFVSAPR